MPTIDFDAIVASIDDRYEPLTIPYGAGKQVVLIQALRLPAEKRAAIAQIQASLNTGDEDVVDTAEREARLIDGVKEILRLAAEDPDPVDGLLERVGDDLAVLMDILQRYAQATDLGNPSASAN